MSEKDVIFSGKIRHVGIFDFKETYRFIYDWLVDKEYRVEEKKYSEKITPGGKEIEIEWNCSRKVSDYFRFIIKVSWRIVGMKNVEVQKDGAKVGMNKGDIEIKFSAILEKDYEHRWENSGFLKFLRGVYDRYIIKGRIENYEDKISNDVDELIAQAKSWFALEGKK